MNREQRRALEKAEKKTPSNVCNKELTPKCVQWIQYLKEKGMDFNVFFIAFSAWLNLTRDEKTATVIELVSQGLVTPDKEHKNDGSGWHKVDANGEVIDGNESEE